MAKIATAVAQKKSSPSSGTGRLSDSQRREIEKLAYQFYVERGYQDGYHEQDWLRAEAIVRSRRN